MDIDKVQALRSGLPAKGLIVLAVLSVPLLAVAFYNFLLFHTLAEGVAITIGVMMCAVAWQTYQFSPNSFLIFLANGFFWVSVLDFLHACSYKGINIFPGNNTDVPTQFWIAARYCQAVLLLVSPYFLARKVSSIWSFFIFGGVAAVLTVGIFRGVFPDAYVEGQGLTPFKVYSEYVIVGILVAAIGHFWQARRLLEAPTFNIFVLSILTTIGSEIAFTLYDNVYELSNIAGHVLKFYSYSLIYISIVREMLTKPYLALRQESVLHQRTDVALAESERQKRLILNTLPDLVWLKDVSGKYLACNPVFERLYGAREAEIVGKSDHDFVDRDLADFFRRHDRNAMEANGPTINEERLTFADDGHSIEAETIKTPLKDESGKVIGVLGIARDISARKEAERALNEAKDLAEKSSQAKSDFLASMSHELRTPLNAILGYSQLLEYLPSSKLSEKQREYVDNIIKSGEDLLALINDVIDLARVESDRLAIFLESLPLSDIIAESVRHLALVSQAKDIEVVDEVSRGEFPNVLSDRVRCKQILINLVGNAVKYSNPGAKVWIRAAVREGKFIRVSIVDEGIGIPEDRHGELFQMFNRAQRDPMRTVEGTGVGLAVTKMLLARLGGRIGFESEEGKGSTFWFDLPLDTNETVLIWTDDYRVGVDAIDKDHQVIFRLANRVMETDLEEREVAAVIEEMIAYTSYHFRREEAIMAACAHPDLPAHRERHHQLEAYVAELAETWKTKKDLSALVRLRSFLREWWRGHIMDVDKSIARSAEGKGVEIARALSDLPAD